MKTRFYFPMAKIAQLIVHTRNAEKHNGVFHQTHDRNFRRIPNPVIPPGLVFVKDEGVYLMSNGLTEGKSPGEAGVVVYAHGYDPQKNPDYYEKAAAFSGDDFCEFIDLEWMGDILKETEGYFMVICDEVEIGIGWAEGF